MQDTTLQFKTANDLWNFKMKIDLSEMEINFNNNTLLSQFSPEQIALAIEEFKAHVKDKPKN
ncbi:MAG: hypothetical protein EON98_06000 [Chitinophagaceae bacterium]|nr:MAG: hypothetical protein EON98_06000 [Chitinophagaceae bacterium]